MRQLDLRKGKHLRDSKSVVYRVDSIGGQQKWLIRLSDGVRVGPLDVRYLNAYMVNCRKPVTRKPTDAPALIEEEEL